MSDQNPDRPEQPAVPGAGSDLPPQPPAAPPAAPPVPPTAPPAPPAAPPAAPAYGAPAYDAPAPADAPPYAQPGAYPPPVYGTPGAYPQAQAYGSGAYTPYPTGPKTNSLAIVSLIFSIVGIIFILPFIGSVVAVITGHISLKQIKTRSEGGRGLALAGTIIGWVGVVLALIGIVSIIAFVAWASSNPGYYEYGYSS
ncbi:DUF4190 domain-containing protein [Microbacterium sp. NPDC089189]|uniref:DUF4190 domain-containing protein n=1 Tax=Microbacterium sp. NPDC089189 TaxID=3154972 RepID=UPI0034309150